MQVARRGVEAKCGIGNGKNNAIPFELCVRLANRANEVRPPNLTPDQVIGMVHHAHLVGFCVAHTQLTDRFMIHITKMRRVPGAAQGDELGLWRSAVDVRLPACFLLPVT